MTADLGTMQRLPHLIPLGIMRELAYTGRKFAAQEAGLINKVYPDHESMLAGVVGVAKQIAAQSPLAVAGCKEMINYSRDHSVADSLKYMATWQAGMFRPQDMMMTFMAKAQKKQRHNSSRYGRLNHYLNNLKEYNRQPVRLTARL